MDRYIREVVAVCDAVGAKHRSQKKIMLAFDEYNVWWKARPKGRLKKLEGWPEAPAFNEEIYNFEDALVLGGALLVLLNNADRVKIACLAQLVNVIAPIMTEPGGKAWRQTIFFPFADVASTTLGDLNYLLSSVTHDAAAKRICVFALNRHLSEEMRFSLELRGLPGDLELLESRVLAGFDLAATNSAGEQTVRPAAGAPASIEGTSLQARLAPASWNVFVLSYE
jgi:alpha-N-arabinofuranosidase